MESKKKLELKPFFVERMKKILGKDFDFYLRSINEPIKNYIRCNTLKITPEELKLKLENKGWKIFQPFNNFPEIMLIKNKLAPGELGSSLEHVLGYYYVQDVASMMPVLALDPKPNEFVLDIASSPGSKTTQIAAKMQNKGTIIANDISLGRIKILASNLERCGVSNTIILRKDGGLLCDFFIENGSKFDKILFDAPCSGEGTLKSSDKTARIWNINTVKKMSKIQKRILRKAIRILKKDGVLVYSTCTHSPEENEEVINFVLNEFKNEIVLEEIKIPLRCRPGILNWENSFYSEEIIKTCRIYPQDNDSEGFFIAKIKKLK
ncbi:MAG: tRNA methyltransferase [Candidatus Pacearchaeota archaeon]|nr:MAG: tRNA methyltransferase [Candidatus Pacearchaeota archaeon]